MVGLARIGKLLANTLMSEIRNQIFPFQLSSILGKILSVNEIMFEFIHDLRSCPSISLGKLITFGLLSNGYQRLPKLLEFIDNPSSGHALLLSVKHSTLKPLKV